MLHIGNFKNSLVENQHFFLEVAIICWIFNVIRFMRLWERSMNSLSWKMGENENIAFLPGFFGLFFPSIYSEFIYKKNEFSFLYCSFNPGLGTSQIPLYCDFYFLGWSNSWIHPTPLLLQVKAVCLLQPN